jgi:SAM-dependent methyltransferase
LLETPVPLAFERAFECHILSQQEFSRPILDVGCGDGIFAKMLFDEKVDTGIDPLAYELEYAKKTNKYDELIEAFGDKIPKPDNHFSSAFSNSVLEHIPDLDSVLKEVHRVLKPGGAFYATIPTNYFDKHSFVSRVICGLGLKKLGARYTSFFNSFWKHYHFYDRAGWENMFERNGFKVENVIIYGAPKDCLFNDSMAPFCIHNFLIKKIANRWIVIPFLRPILAGMWHSLLTSRVKVYDNLEDGGLIFLKLLK